MGLRFELLLIAIAAAVLMAALTIEIEDTKYVQGIETKELEFEDTIIREVDMNGSLSVSYGSKGVRNNGLLIVQQVRYHTNNIKLLRAKRGIYKGDEVYLDYNIIVNKEIGSDYYAEHAVYNQMTGILKVNSNFTAIMGKNTMTGNGLIYDSIKKTAFAKNVNADIYTSEK